MKTLDLGKVMETYFEKDCNTSWVIDALEQKKGQEYYYDTLKLFRMFHLNLTDPSGNSNCYSVSLYIKRAEDCNGDAFDSKLTLSKIKKAYAENSFNENDAENDVLLTALINRAGSLDWELEKQDIMFDTRITSKAPALVNWCERAKTKISHVVGMSLDKLI
jgi:hypothetical protein